MRTFQTLAIAAATASLLFSASARAQDKGTIGVAMPTKSSARWINAPARTLRFCCKITVSLRSAPILNRRSKRRL